MSRWKNSALGRTVRTWRGGLSLAVLVMIAMAATNEVTVHDT